MKQGITYWRDLPDRKRWAVTSEIDGIQGYVVARPRGVWDDIKTEAQIVIPIELMDDMTDEEIGRTARSLIPAAMSCAAFGTACQIIEKKKSIFKDWERQGEWVARAKVRILEFANHEEFGRAAEYHIALDVIAEFEAHAERKGLGKTAKRYERASAAKDFDALFIAVGRRDGFRCAACGVVENLQLDHIEPVGFGGATHPDNLQLLCKPCNLQKGERTQDFRGTQHEQDVQ